MNSKSAPVKLWVNGASGKMGQKIFDACSRSKNFAWIQDVPYSGRTETEQEKLDANILACELILDFSSREANLKLLSALSKFSSQCLKSKSILIGTTGLNQTDLSCWKSLIRERNEEAAGLKLLFAPNTSIGILLAAQAAARTARAAYSQGFDIEIVETHHRDKIDQPSGTANFLAAAITNNISELRPTMDRSGAREKNELGIHSIRGGGIYGEHEIRMISEFEEIKISHRALSRDLFAQGALSLGGWLSSRIPGYYGLLDVNLQDLQDKT